jgi:hypothetical protein
MLQRQQQHRHAAGSERLELGSEQLRLSDVERGELRKRRLLERGDVERGELGKRRLLERGDIERGNIERRRPQQHELLRRQ